MLAPHLPELGQQDVCLEEYQQGIEGTKKAIKKDHTFERRCPLGTFMDIVSRMVMEGGGGGVA